jgi:hypothetical protein
MAHPLLTHCRIMAAYHQWASQRIIEQLRVRGASLPCSVCDNDRVCPQGVSDAELYAHHGLCFRSCVSRTR